MQRLKPQIQKTWVVGLFVLSLFGCGDRTFPMPKSWKTYENPRFSFELPYPGDWTSARVPSNLDGRTFYHPQNPEVRVTGWGGYLLRTGESGNISEVTPANFTTDQGVRGKLTVEVASEVTLVRLTLIDEAAIYHFEGRSPSGEFADYYRLFYDMASQYRIGETVGEVGKIDRGRSEF
ncbi:hypothetical protein IQ235_18130 [Oscillatoriales cyanobacterium LEGE 11467]|uniref:Uncharacterized protein n=1 Tax=Zarconia navalis LEGE 11467 TaxID=1828826 RepID=A0A928Z8N7_9CYAN|nr:hypothetical protein [Zarconia navalis]MBE9042682.1 hypothetical protein [Zarconia navalis LEGE 11467]